MLVVLAVLAVVSAPWDLKAAVKEHGAQKDVYTISAAVAAMNAADGVKSMAEQDTDRHIAHQSHSVYGGKGRIAKFFSADKGQSITGGECRHVRKATGCFSPDLTVTQQRVCCHAAEMCPSGSGEESILSPVKILLIACNPD